METKQEIVKYFSEKFAKHGCEDWRYDNMNPIEIKTEQLWFDNILINLWEECEALTEKRLRAEN